MTNQTSSLELSHFPVMLDEVLEISSPANGGKFIDCTFGGGGYTREILKFSNTSVLAIDRDKKILAKANELEKVQSLNLSQNSDEMAIVSEDIQNSLEPQSLGTLEIPIETTTEDSPFEIKLSDQGEDQQEIINTISQDSPVLVEEQLLTLNILPEGDELGQYQYAYNLLKQGDYETAEKAFMEFISLGTDKKLLSDSNWWLAETYYVRGNYKDAAKSYLNLYQNYPEAPKAPKALLKLGISLVNMDQREQGCVTFLELQEAFPAAEETILQRGILEVQKNGCQVS